MYKIWQKSLQVCKIWPRSCVTHNMAGQASHYTDLSICFVSRGSKIAHGWSTASMLLKYCVLVELYTATRCCINIILKLRWRLLQLDSMENRLDLKLSLTAKGRLNDERDCECRMPTHATVTELETTPTELHKTSIDQKNRTLPPVNTALGANFLPTVWLDLSSQAPCGSCCWRYVSSDVLIYKASGPFCQNTTSMWTTLTSGNIYPLNIWVSGLKFSYTKHNLWLLALNCFHLDDTWLFSCVL